MDPLLLLALFILMCFAPVPPVQLIGLIGIFVIGIWMLLTGVLGIVTSWWIVPILLVVGFFFRNNLKRIFLEQYHRFRR